MLPGPKGIPEHVGRYLVTKETMSPDRVWTLKAVIIPRLAEKNVIDVRVYDSNEAQRNDVKVVNYHSLDDHPALVIFDGWYNKETHAVGKMGL
jgi:hypothetical protein